MYAQFENKRVLVTGASSGIGQRIAETFQSYGANVVGLDKNVSRSSSGFKFAEADLADSRQVSAVCERLRNEADSLDILVNAAGVLRVADAENLTNDDWSVCMDINAGGPFYLMREWIPVFKRQRHGVIVNVASNAAHVPRVGMGAYCASKAALASLSQCIGLELAPFGIRCNIVSPGSTTTPMLERMLDGNDSGPENLISGLPQDFKLGIPLGKIGTPDDVTAAVLFLASDQAAHITMQDIVVDGGATLGA